MKRSHLLTLSCAIIVLFIACKITLHNCIISATYKVQRLERELQALHKEHDKKSMLLATLKSPQRIKQWAVENGFEPIKPKQLLTLTTTATLEEKTNAAS